MYCVYVIELDYAAGLRRNLDKPCVYVGQTCHRPEERFQQHRYGRRAAKVVQRHGIRLKRRLYVTWNPIATRSEAERAEAKLAARLEKRGYTVFGGH